MSKNRERCVQEPIITNCMLLLAGKEKIMVKEQNWSVAHLYPVCV